MNRLQEIRESISPKLSQAELAKRAGVSQPVISEVERGAGTTVQRAQRIVSALISAGAINEAGDPVTLDDVFPPENSEPIAANS